MTGPRQRRCHHDLCRDAVVLREMAFENLEFGFSSCADMTPGALRATSSRMVTNSSPRSKPVSTLTPAALLLIVTFGAYWPPAATTPNGHAVTLQHLRIVDVHRNHANRSDLT